MSKTSDLVRTNFKKNDDIRDAGLTIPEDVARYVDIIYGPDPDWQVLDLYRPKDAEGRVLPVIVSVHGGGWVYGDKELYQYYCMSLAQRGFAVINYTYRLAPEFQYPASVEDTNLVMTWIMEHAEAYKLDTDHIFAVGDSAGAHNLAIYTCILTNPDYAASYTFTPPQGLSLKAVAYNCGQYQIDLTAEGEELTAALMADLLPERGSPKELNLVSPILHMTADHPPVFVMTAPKDFLRDQASLLVKKLLELDVPFIFRFYADPARSLAHVFHCDMRSEYGALCNTEECNFFKEFL